MSFLNDIGLNNLIDKIKIRLFDNASKNLLSSTNWVQGLLSDDDSAENIDMTNKYYITSPYISVDAKFKKITITAISGNIQKIYQLDNDKNKLAFYTNIISQDTHFTITLNEDCKYIRFSMGSNMTITSKDYNNIVKAQVEYGDKSTYYEDYYATNKTLFNTTNNINAYIIDNANKNLLQIPRYYNTEVIDGVTYTLNRDNTGELINITANGIANSTVANYYITLNTTLPNGRYIFTSGIQDIYNGKFKFIYLMNNNNVIEQKELNVKDVINITDNNKLIGFYLKTENGYNANNIICKPMIRQIDIDNEDYEVFYKTQKQLNKSVNAIEDLLIDNNCRNLLPLTLDNIKTLNEGNWNDNTYIINGLTITINSINNYVSDIIVNGNANATTILNLGNYNLNAGRYILSGCPSNGKQQTKYVLRALSDYYDEGNGVEFYNENQINVSLIIYNNNTVSNLIFKPMIRYATVSNDIFEPYRLNNKQINDMLVDINNDIDELYISKIYTEVTYNQLVNLINNNELIKGGQYRITDYNTTTTQNDTQSANHQFDIIVTADDSNKLNHNAKAIQHINDTYFVGSNLAAWELKYDINNNTSKYIWADNVNGKGVIYYMKDEFNNKAGYDFKNIMFKYYKITDIVTNSVCANCTGLIGTYSSSKVFAFNQYTTDDYFTININDYQFKYTFNKDNEDFSINNKCFNNTISPYQYEEQYVLNHISFDTTNTIYNNQFNNFNYNISFLGDCHNNIFNGCHSIITNNMFYSNIIDNYSSWLFFDEACYFNKLSMRSRSNGFGQEFQCNIVDTEFINNQVGKKCQYNHFKINTQNQIFADEYKNHTWGEGDVTSSELQELSDKIDDIINDIYTPY